MKAAVFILHLYCICAYVRADACQPDDCRGGDCELTRLPNGSIQKSCHCVKGVCGDTCQRLCNATSQCTANPCWFGGTCIDVANLDYICLCPPNHTGKDCRTLIACEPTSCQNGGTCVQSAYGAQCSCPANFRGDFCQYTTIAKPTKKVPVAEYRQFDDDTISAIAGLGSSSTSEQSYNQRMFAIAMGNRSQFVFCLTNPCENGGSCFITNSATTKGICICHEGYIGDYCEIVHNKTSNGIRLHNGFCATNPCQHDGTCVEVGLIDGYCRCSPQYRGPNCEIIVRSFGCHPNPCKNGGTCVMLENNQAQCLCTPVFRGITCNQFSYVPCGDATCHGSQGMCVSNKCVCKQGFAGPRCDSTDFCSAYPCLNGGTCIQTNDEPYGGCSCPPEFSGPTCSNDPCNPSPCLNGGQCIRKPDNQFYCQCRNKNRGIYCEQADCFPADATVDVQGVGKVELSSLKIGQEVRVIDDQDQLSYSPIIAFLHRDLNEEGSYVRLRTKTALIELSPRHLIHSRSSGFVWAEKLSKGDEILVVSSKRPNETHWEAIVEIRDVEKPGLMAPLTEQGTIVVNNVHASCYALVRSHSIGHLALAPYRWYRRAFGRSSDGAVSTPILNYANILLHFFKNLPIVRDLIF